MMRFERVQKYPDAVIPTRATEKAAGYDLYAAEDTVIPSYLEMMKQIELANEPNLDDALSMLFGDFSKSKSTKFNNIHDVFKEEKFKDYRPTLVPTGIKIYLDDDKSFDIQPRSSLPRKNWLIVANAPGLIDADYVDTPECEGQIYVQLINLAPFPFTIKKGEKFAQGVIRQYFTVDNDIPGGKRMGGIGSTDKIFTKEEFASNLFNRNPS